MTLESFLYSVLSEGFFKDWCDCKIIKYYILSFKDDILKPKSRNREAKEEKLFSVKGK